MRGVYILALPHPVHRRHAGVTGQSTLLSPLATVQRFKQLRITNTASLSQISVQAIPISRASLKSNRLSSRSKKCEFTALRRGIDIFLDFELHEASHGDRLACALDSCRTSLCSEYLWRHHVRIGVRRSVYPAGVPLVVLRRCSSQRSNAHRVHARCCWTMLHLITLPWNPG